jgi:hypothetical protein
MSRSRQHESSLTDDEAKAIIEAVVAGHRRKGASEQDVHLALKWANAVRSELALLELVLEGRLAITSVKKNGFKTDELTFVDMNRLP